jgi:hypothetical protein
MTDAGDPSSGRPANVGSWGAPSVPTPEASPADQSRRPRAGGRLRRLSRLTKVLIVSVALLIAVGIGIGAWYLSGEQQRDYDKGHEAYLAGNCTEATGPLGEAASSDTDDDLADKAQAELDECEALLAGDALGTQGEHADAVLSYSEFLTTYPRSPIVDIALTRGQTLIAGPPERIGTLPLCGALDRLEAQGFIAASDDVLAPLLLSCGEAYEGEGDFERALAMFDRIRVDDPDHPLITAVDEAYVRVTLAQADATGAGELSPPAAVGPADDASGAAVVLIQNGSAERLTIVFSGPEQRVEELPPCAECDVFADAESATCPETGPEARYELQPGSYDVVVKATSGSSVIPFRGTWPLDAGQQYAQCFFIVQQ